MEGIVLKLTMALGLTLPTAVPSHSITRFTPPVLTASEIRMTNKASPYIPGLKASVNRVWPDMPYPAMFAALIEKESLWNPRAELCVPKGTCSREYGFGFGQFTITPRFNVFNEIKQMLPELRNWKYEDRFNTQNQMLGLVAKNKGHYRQCSPLMTGVTETLACTFSSYNGGFGGVLSDRRVCSNTQGCDPTKWFDNVENTSTKAKVPISGYGQSFFQINRGYVKALVIERPVKYTIFSGFESLP